MYSELRQWPWQKYSRPSSSSYGSTLDGKGASSYTGITLLFGGWCDELAWKWSQYKSNNLGEIDNNFSFCPSNIYIFNQRAIFIDPNIFLLGFILFLLHSPCVSWFLSFKLYLLLMASLHDSIPPNNLVYFDHISTANPLPIIYLESNRMVNLPYIGYLQSLRYSWILKVNEILNPIIVIIPQYFVDCSSQLLFYWFRWFDFFRYYIVLWSW